MRALTKDTVRLQKESLFLQDATLTEIADILAQEKLQAINFDKAIDALRIEQSVAARNGLWATSFLGMLIVLVLLKLWSPSRKKESPLDTAPPSDESEQVDSANIKTSMVTIDSSSLAQQMANDDLSFELTDPKMAANVDTLRGGHPFVSSIQVEKAVPLLLEDEMSYPSIKETLGDDLSTILAQAENIRQESLERISHPKKQNHIPPLI